MTLQHLNSVNWNHIPASKFASLIRTNPADCQIALIGLPDDTGVQLNNGRSGAKEGPSAFRKALAKYGVAEPAEWSWPTVFDAGDVDVVPGDLHETHRRVTDAVQTVLDLGLFPIGIGGGHDLTFPFVRAVAKQFGSLNGIYFDAHLDVRETDGSGMPFRKLLETGAAKSMRVHGLDPNSNSQEHVHWFKTHGGHIANNLDHDDPWPTTNTFVSLDLDVIDQSHAPGVSAHNACGWTSTQTEAWVLKAGQNPLVRCFDIMELSPPYDRDERTARIAARMFLTFLRGYSERTQ
ncbi:MAG: formimidoylglutamase [Phycisphaerales bacterium]|nr:formimidoylglutamase [Phycisphaerales bacterium]